MSTQNERNTALLTHLSGFLGAVFPFGSIIGPLILWSANKDKGEFLQENSREAVNFNISYTLYLVILGMFMFPFAFGSFFNYLKNIDDWDHLDFHFGFGSLFGFASVATIISVITVLRYILIIVAAVKASRGETYNYPLTINFIK